MPEQQNPIKDAIGFLKYLATGWPDNVYVQVEAITPVMVAGTKADIKRKTVAPADIDDIGPWLEEHKGANLHFRPNPLAGPTGSGGGGAAVKADILAATCVHVDLDPIDPPAGADKAEHHAAERERLRKQIDAFPLAPSFLIDSGGGYQAFWKLVTPATVAEAEAINKALCAHFQTPDACWSAQHLMRLPHTMNWPGYKKQEKGRTKVPAVLLAHTEVAYCLEAFDFLPRAAAATSSKALSVPTGDLPPRFVELLAGDEELRARCQNDPGDMPDQSRNAIDLSIVSRAVAHGFNDAEITRVLHSLPDSKVVRDGRGADYIRPMLDKCRKPLVLKRKEPRTTAYRMVAERFTSPDGVRLLRHWNGVFYTYRSGAYHERDEKGVRAAVWQFLGGACQWVSAGKTTGKPAVVELFNPTSTEVTGVLDALMGITYEQIHLMQPCWLDGANGDDPRDLLVMANGVLNLRSRTLQPHDPRLFTTTALPFAYDADAGDPRQWLAFLNSVWGDDHESTETLQEMFGYILSGDRSQQKILLIIGPPRSGKGTIIRVLCALVGAANTCSPSMEKLADRFGMEPLVDKTLAIFPDVRLDGRTSQKALANVLLPVSGQDQQTFDRKYKPAYTGTLGVQFVMSSNELPAILDSSGALSSRFVVLETPESFLGREDTGLLNKLLPELPAILNWALDGLERLQQRGAFVQPQSAMELVEELANLGSPIMSFVSDCCVVGPNEAVDTVDLYSRWKMWCEQQGRHSPGTQAMFGRDLRSKLTKVKRKKSRIGGMHRDYVGIGLKRGTSTVEDLRGVPGKSTAAVADLDAEREKRKALLL